MKKIDCSLKITCKYFKEKFAVCVAPEYPDENRTQLLTLYNTVNPLDD